MRCMRAELVLDITWGCSEEEVEVAKGGWAEW